MSNEDWPKNPDGTAFSGQNLMTLIRDKTSPFQNLWDVNLLLQEVETNLGARVNDIPMVYKGSNNYGFHLVLSNGLNVIARLARSDVNTPDFDGFPIHVQIPEVEFEAAVYHLLKESSHIPVSRLYHFRVPKAYPTPSKDQPSDLAGRRLFVFEMAEGKCNVWKTLDPAQKKCLLERAASIRADLFNFDLPEKFATQWLRERLFEQKPESLSAPVSATREFCIALFQDKINATIKNIGDMIGWESDNNTVGPKAAAAKQSLLRYIPNILPKGNDSLLFRLVLEHGDYGIHNTSITMDEKDLPLITSLFDWETGQIVPAILSDPLMAVTVDLISDDDAAPSMTRLKGTETPEEIEKYMLWSKQYFEVLYDQAPEYKTAIQQGKDARHLWFALRDWRGDDPEDYFGELGIWAEERMKEMNVS